MTLAPPEGHISLARVDMWGGLDNSGFMQAVHLVTNNSRPASCVSYPIPTGSWYFVEWGDVGGSTDLHCCMIARPVGSTNVNFEIVTNSFGDWSAYAGGSILTTRHIWTTTARVNVRAGYSRLFSSTSACFGCGGLQRWQRQRADRTWVGITNAGFFVSTSNLFTVPRSPTPFTIDTDFGGVSVSETLSCVVFGVSRCRGGGVGLWGRHSIERGDVGESE